MTADELKGLRDYVRRTESDHRVRFANDDYVGDYGYANACKDICEVIDAMIASENMNEHRCGWYDTAAEMSRNAEFYRGIVIQIGEMFGPAARTADDGTVTEDVLALKVSELVASLLAPTATKGE